MRHVPIFDKFSLSRQISICIWAKRQCSVDKKKEKKNIKNVKNLKCLATVGVDWMLISWTNENRR